MTRSEMSHISDHDVRAAFEAESELIGSDSVTRVKAKLKDTAPMDRRPGIAGLSLIAVAAFAASVAAIGAAGGFSSASPDSNVAGPMSILAPPMTPGEGPPCLGAQEVDAKSALAGSGKQPVYLPAGSSLEQAITIWSCSGSGIAALLPGNTIVLSGQVGEDEELSDADRSANYRSYVESVSEKATKSTDGSEPMVTVVQNVPALVVPRYPENLMSLVEFEVNGTQIRITNDGSVPMSELVKLAESLTPAQD
jgi:hypothetical protein